MRPLVLSVAALTLVACGSADAKPTPPAASAPESKPKRDERSTAAASPPNAQATRVEVAVLRDSDASLEATIPGEVEGSRDAVLASAQGGPVERVLVSEGDRVKRGQLLMRIDTALYEIRKRQAETDLARATRNLERASGLGTALPQAERERRESEVKMLETNLDLARLQLSRSLIRAPFGGVVAELHAEVGEVVAATAPLMHLVRLDPVHVVLSVPDRDVVALDEGTEVEVSVPAVPRPLPGKIIRINPTGDQETRAFRAEVEVENGDMKVLPGMIASVRLDRTLETGGVVIPQDWLITRRDGVGVFLEQDGVVHYRPVKAGRVVRDQVIIDEGLQAGDRIVITGHRQLADGDPVVITREGQCCKRGRVAFD
ncbi:MAG: efflux RND transporter periplasmic adaptor subunit [Myxococcales bacterium]|jgi:membrane fusion protein (multidrug efflux system)